jgi:glycosyltransferase involved in cell wall biosynthesis
MVLQNSMEGNKVVLPLVSVIIAVHNGEMYIADTINSVLAQTYANIEVIIIDDASTDKTAETLHKFSAEPAIITIKNNENIGAAAARNIGYNHTKGQFIKFLDGDDLINPEAISEQIKLAIQNQNCIISGKWGRFYKNDVTTFKLNPEDCWQTLESTDWICTSWKNAQSMTNPGIFLIPRELIDKAGLWDESLSLIDDLEYFTRTILTANKVVFCEGATLYYRSGIANSLSGTKTSKGYQSAYISIEKATRALLARRNDKTAKLVCANTWQSFVYDAYPVHPNLVQQAQVHLNNLPPSQIKLAGGNLAKLLRAIFGWKVVKKLQNLDFKKILKIKYNRVYQKTE